jgi:hypothetical protein
MSAPFIVRVAVSSLAHFKVKPHLVAHDVNLAIPRTIDLAGAFLALSLAAFLVAFDIGFRRFHKSPRDKRPKLGLK